MTQATRRRLASLSVFGLCLAAAACGSDGLVLPDESRAAKIEIVAGDAQSAPAGATLGQQIVVKVTDALNRPVEGQSVAFSVGTGAGQVTPPSAVTGSDGRAAATWTLGNAAGQQRAQAQISGDDLQVEFHASATSGAGAVLEVASGDGQTAAVGSALPDSLVVRVTDELGNPVAGVEVTWSVTGGGSISPASVVSGADGLAAAERVLGNASGAQSAQASSGALSPVTFTHTAEPANPTMLLQVSGDAQAGSAGAALADPLVVRLVDNNGNGVGGKAITWVVGSGGGSVDPVTVTTNPNGFAQTVWTLGPSTGSNLLNAVYSGVPSVPFTATAQAGVAAKLAFAQPPVTTSAGSTITPAVRVAIQDASGNTVTSANGSVTVAIGANPSGGVLSGTTTVTAVNGIATFSTLSIDKTGNGYTLTAISSGLIDATSSTFDILTGSANRLVFITGPTDRVVGEKFSPALQVQVQDAGGNPVLFAGQITLISSTTGTLSGTATVTPILGTATFSNLAINRAGDGYTLTALSSGVASQTSSAFNVAQAATAIDFTQSKATTVTGETVTFNYDVDVVAPGVGTLTGTVTVSDGSQECTAGVTGAGSGTCAIAFSSTGARNITATYNGDENFALSTSAPTAHTVNKANTSVNVVDATPDPSLVNQLVTVHWDLSPSGAGSGTPSGSVVVTATGSAGCTATVTAFGAGSCSLVFTTTNNSRIKATYSGDANFNGSNDDVAHSVVEGVPTAQADAYDVDEDATLSPNAAAGVLANDSDPDLDPLTAVLNAGPSHAQSFTLNGDGSFTYVPAADYNGEDSFTYRASDGTSSSGVVTVTITVAAVNDAPSFIPGDDITVSAADGAFGQPWATGSVGPSNESGQALTYVASVDLLGSLLFSAPPAIDPDGTLHFTPNGLPGTATVTVHVEDDGGTANGGVNTSAAQAFTVTITIV